jgi:hypothetical protein
VTGWVIEPSYRDENLEEVAQITQPDLGKADAIRYLNVYESPGSLSLAVRPGAIDSVQGISLPVRMVEVTTASSLFREIVQIRAQADQLEATRAAELDPLEQLRRKVAERESVPFVRSPTSEQSELLERICQLVADEYLPGISCPVRAKFADALHAWRSAQEAPVDDAAYISRFASMARALTHPEETLQALKAQAGR